MKIDALAAQAAKLLNDLGHTTWSLSDLRGWLVDGELAVLLVRPEANTVSMQLALQVGSRQSIPSNGSRLIKVARNDSSTSKRAINLVDEQTKNQFDPGWQEAPNSTVIYEYTFDDRDPKKFNVSPPAASGAVVQIIYSAVPAAYSFELDPDFTIDAIYSPAILQWALYRSLSGAKFGTPDYARALDFQQSFFNLLGVAAQADQAIQPNPYQNAKAKSSAK